MWPVWIVSMYACMSGFYNVFSIIYSLTYTTRHRWINNNTDDKIPSYGLNTDITILLWRGNIKFGLYFSSTVNWQTWKERWLEGLTSAGAPPPDRRLGYFLAGDGAPVWLRVMVPIRTLLHPLHHQAQQAGHRLLHIDASHRTCLKVGDSDEKESFGWSNMLTLSAAAKRRIYLEALSSSNKKISFSRCLSCDFFGGCDPHVANHCPKPIINPQDGEQRRKVAKSSISPSCGALMKVLSRATISAGSTAGHKIMGSSWSKQGMALMY